MPYNFQFYVKVKAENLKNKNDKLVYKIKINPDYFPILVGIKRYSHGAWLSPVRAPGSGWEKNIKNSLKTQNTSKNLFPNDSNLI